MSTDDLDTERDSRRPYVSPAVSIILPTFNRKRWLERAVASVLAQTFTDWELIVADDGSDVETKTYLRSLDSMPNVQILWLAHCGNPSRVRNAALRDARARSREHRDPLSDMTGLPRERVGARRAPLPAPLRRAPGVGVQRADARERGPGTPAGPCHQPQPFLKPAPR